MTSGFRSQPQAFIICLMSARRARPHRPEAAADIYSDSHPQEGPGEIRDAMPVAEPAPRRTVQLAGVVAPAAYAASTCTVELVERGGPVLGQDSRDGAGVEPAAVGVGWGKRAGSPTAFCGSRTLPRVTAVIVGEPWRVCRRSRMWVVLVDGRADRSGVRVWCPFGCRRGSPW
jgi:hypothetical protein